MFGIGFGEMLMIAVVVLIAVGPKKMPTFMKAMGKGLREFRRATRELKNAAGLDELLRDDDLKNPLALKQTYKPKPAYQMTAADRLDERPKAGTDISHASDHPNAARAFRPPPPKSPDMFGDAGPEVVAQEEQEEQEESAEPQERVAHGAGAPSDGSDE